MIDYELSLWTEIVVSVLIVAASVFTLVGAIGMVKFNEIFARIHAPAIISSLANWCFMLASIWFFSAVDGYLVPNAILVTILVTLTAPISTIFIMRVSLFRRRNIEHDVPANSSYKAE